MMENKSFLVENTNVKGIYEIVWLLVALFVIYKKHQRFILENKRYELFPWCLRILSMMENKSFLIENMNAKCYC